MVGEVNLDQHFLLDSKVLNRIIELAELSNEDVVLEIGAGKGNLTKLLAKKVKKVYAIEKDEKLFFKLKSIDANVEAILGNALKLKFPKFNKIISNIPYSISEPLIQKLLHYNFDLGVLLLPEKFSKILVGEKESKLSLITSSFFEIKLKEKVSPLAFSPRPKVYSRIVILKPKKSNFNEAIFQEFVKQRDKKAKNALREAIIKAGERFGKKIAKRQARKIISNFNIEKKVQNLNFKELSKIKSYTENLRFDDFGNLF